MAARRKLEKCTPQINRSPPYLQYDGRIPYYPNIVYQIHHILIGLSRELVYVDRGSTRNRALDFVLPVSSATDNVHLTWRATDGHKVV